MLPRPAELRRGKISNRLLEEPLKRKVAEKNRPALRQETGSTLSLGLPREPRSNWAATGLYFCDEQAVDIAAGLKPSGRGELEIFDVIRTYIERGQLEVKRMGRGFAWFDMETPRQASGGVLLCGKSYFR